MHVGHRSQKFRLGLFLLIGTISITTLFSVPAQAVAPVRASLVSPASTAPWTQVGPSGQTVGGSPWGDSGRVQSIAFDPTNPQVVYAGTSTGGVWKTTDEGRTWVPLTDSQNSLTAGALAVGPNPSDIYEFTGTDASNFHFSTVEGGVLASTDAGQTWSRVDGTFFDHRFSDNSLVADQLKPNLIYAAVPDSDPNGWTGAATAGGVYKSIDGGQHWTAALTGSTAGCSGSFIQRDSLAGVVQNGATVLYAGIACQNGTNSGLWQSKDGGSTWTDLSSFLAVVPSADINSLDTFVTGTDPAAPGTVYVATGAGTNGVDNLDGVYRTVDGGVSWQDIVPNPATPFGTLGGDFGYNHDLAVSPTDPNTVYLTLGDPFQGTLSGGVWTWTDLHGSSGSPENFHGDSHTTRVGPDGTLWAGTDGGLYMSQDGGHTWAERTGDHASTSAIEARQDFGISVGSGAQPLALQGTQDNAMSSYSGSGAWTFRNGGDVSNVYVDPTSTTANPVVYFSYSNVVKTTNAWQSQANLPVSGSTMTFDPSNPQRVLVATGGSGDSQIWQSTDGGATGANLPVAPFAGTNDSVLAVTIAPTAPNTIYASSFQHGLSATTDGGKTWTIGAGTLCFACLTSIGVSPLSSSVAYTTLAGYGGVHVKQTTDSGKTWQDVTGNLPNVPANTVQIDGAGNVYVGLDRGAYELPNGSSTWAPIGSGLPNAIVSQLVLSGNNLYAGTYGRGMWMIPLGGASAPGVSTGVTATSGTYGASVSWVPPAANGGSPIYSYSVVSSPGGVSVTTNGRATSAFVGGLTPGTSYSFTVTATNVVGTGPASSPSSGVIPSGSSGGTISGLVSPTCGAWSIQQNLQVGNLGWSDRTYTIATLPASLAGSQWIRPMMVCKTTTQNPEVSFSISSSTVISVAVDTRLGRRSWMDSSWVDTGTQITDNESTPAHLEVFQKTFPAGTVSLGPNVGSGSSYVQYLVIGTAGGGGTTLPGAPTGVSASAGNAQAAITWTAPASNGGSPITGYTVTSSPGNVVATTSGATTANVYGLSDGTAYTFTVTATNSLGPGPASSASGAVTPQATVPSAPADTSAVAGVGQATVSWTQASLNGSPITGYSVISAPGGITTQVGAAADSATVSGLSAGTTYTFTVTATNGIGTGAGSAPTDAITPTAAPTVPGSPTGVGATAGNAQATVAWSPPSSGGSPITAYTVTSNPGSLTATVAGTVTSAIVSGLTNGTTYTFTVTATNAVGVGPVSAASNPVTPTVGATVPGAPTNVVASVGNGQAGVTWTAAASNGSPITGYTVTSAPGGFTSSVGNVTNATVTGLTNGTAYTFTVTATNSVGTGPASAASNSVTPTGPPSAPTNVVATRGDTQAAVTWTAALANGSPITGYTVTSAPGGITSSVGNVTNATVTGLTNGTAYTFTVTATNSVGTGPSSAASNSVTPAGLPSAPTNVVATPGNGQAGVTWTAAPANGSPITGYTVTSAPGGITSSVGNVTNATVTGLTNGTTYTFTVTATNGVGTGAASAASNAVTPSGSGTISNLHVFDTTNASNWSIQSNLQLGAQGWGDRTYTLPTIPSALLGAQYIRPAMASKTSTQNPLVSFSISSQMTVYVAVDVRRGRPTWMASWADTGTQIVDSESTPTHLEVFSMTFAAGTVSLGPNVGTGSSYVQYLVIAR